MSLISIKSATYGVPGNEKDVAFQIQCMPGVGACFQHAEIVVNNSTLGGDPVPGVPKRLRVVYRMGVDEIAVEAAEGTTMLIPGKPKNNQGTFRE